MSFKSSEFVHQVTDGNFKSEVLSSNKPVLVDFWAPWCGPCKALAPVLAEVAEERKDQIKVCNINVDENPQTASELNIRSIPFMAFFQDGQKVSELVGNQPKQVINKHIDGVFK